MNDIKKLAEKVQAALLEAGFIVQRYDAYSSNSIYFKLDYGICNSIRISDHRSKKHLHYRYNLSNTAKSIYTDRSGSYPRYFYPFSEWRTMIEAIKHRRADKLMSLGSAGYEREMREFKSKHENSKGFWEQAYLVNAPAADENWEDKP